MRRLFPLTAVAVRTGGGGGSGSLCGSGSDFFLSDNGVDGCVTRAAGDSGRHVPVLQEQKTGILCNLTRFFKARVATLYLATTDRWRNTGLGSQLFPAMLK